VASTTRSRPGTAAIRRDLGSSLSGLQWVIDDYTLVLGDLLMLGGPSADRNRPTAGRSRPVSCSFGAGSLLCSIATTPAG
jgi:hypothetical protein